MEVKTNQAFFPTLWPTFYNAQSIYLVGAFAFKSLMSRNWRNNEKGQNIAMNLVNMAISFGKILTKSPNFGKTLKLIKVANLAMLAVLF